MINSTRRPGLSKIVNGALVLLAFGLLALVIWRNRDQIGKVLSRPLDLRLFGLALAIYLLGAVLTFVRWFFLVRVIEPHFKLEPRPSCWARSGWSSIWCSPAASAGM